VKKKEKNFDSGTKQGQQYSRFVLVRKKSEHWRCGTHAAFGSRNCWRFLNEPLSRLLFLFVAAKHNASHTNPSHNHPYSTKW
jgi:hypothetical protein